LLSILVNSVLAGGALGSFRDPVRRQSWSNFFQDCVHYGWRMVRLTIIGLICYWIVFGVFNQVLGSAVAKWTTTWMDDRPVFWVHLTQSVLVLIGLGFVNCVMDYARVKLVSEEGISAVAAFFGSLGFSLKRWATWGVYAIPSLGGIALVGAYVLVVSPARWLEQPTLRGRVGPLLLLTILFLIQQVTVWGRYWFRLATWGSEWSLYCGGN
jgi:hypothetical protein